jgi:hypothetical protein
MPVTTPTLPDVFVLRHLGAVARSCSSPGSSEATLMSLCLAMLERSTKPPPCRSLGRLLLRPAASTSCSRDVERPLPRHHRDCVEPLPLVACMCSMSPRPHHVELLAKLGSGAPHLHQAAAPRQVAGHDRGGGLCLIVCEHLAPPRPSPLRLQC